MFIKVRIIIDMNPLKHMAVGGIHVQACQGDSSRDFEWEDADFCNFSGRTSKRTPFTGAGDRPQLHWIIPTCHRRIHSLLARSLRHSEPTVIATAAGFRVGRHLDSALPPRSLVFVCCGIAGRTDRKEGQSSATPSRSEIEKCGGGRRDRRRQTRPGP